MNGIINEHMFLAWPGRVQVQTPAPNRPEHFATVRDSRDVSTAVINKLVTVLDWPRLRRPI